MFRAIDYKVGVVSPMLSLKNIDINSDGNLSPQLLIIIFDCFYDIGTIMIWFQGTDRSGRRMH